MQILSLLSLPDNYISRSVCKKWFVAAREVLKDEEELTFVSVSMGRIPADNGIDLKNAVHFVPYLQTAANIDPYVEKMLSHFKRLTKLTACNDLILRCYPYKYAQSLIQKAYPIIESL